MHCPEVDIITVERHRYCSDRKLTPPTNPAAQPVPATDIGDKRIHPHPEDAWPRQACACPGHGRGGEGRRGGGLNLPASAHAPAVRVNRSPRREARTRRPCGASRGTVTCP